MARQRAPEEARREQILGAAHAVALREGIDGVTVRAVAAEAGVSHGLLIFYFKQKDQLIAALLDRLLATANLLGRSDDVTLGHDALDRLRSLLRDEMSHLARDPHDFRLFLEYWALGTRRPSIRAKIAAALARYRSVLRTMAEDMLGGDPARHDDITADGFAAVAVGLVSGCAIQAMSDPDGFDVAAYIGTVRGLVEQLDASAAGRGHRAAAV